MANLKDIRIRRNSVQATKKITSAMKMIAAAKLRKAQDQAQAARPYAEYMGKMLADLLWRQEQLKSVPKLLAGSGKDDHHLILVVTSNRGLCGSFNSSIVREARHVMRDLASEQKNFSVYCVGRKAYEQLRFDYGDKIVAHKLVTAKPSFHDADTIAMDVIERFERGDFDHCTLIYNRFVTALTQKVTNHRLIPFSHIEEDVSTDAPADTSKKPQSETVESIYEYEPSQEAVLNSLLPKNIKVQIFRALLESAASEHSARMAAMDSATRNADDMIKRLNLTYNRTRQAHITKELIEIISGADAL